ncbi:MAG: hypothetical protein NTV84_02420 [Methanoregula sp.]|nr:hypothetical protein [Methanoregula sp.]
MVLEESLLFANEEDADAFIRFLREKRCRVQKITDSYIFNETLLSGPIKGIIRILEGSNTDPRKLQEGNGNPVNLHTTATLANLNAIHSFISKVMDKFNPGDIILTTEEYEKMKADIAADLEAKLQADPEWDKRASSLAEKLISMTGPLLAEKMPIMDCLITMEDEGLVKTEPEGIRLAKKINPDDLPMERRAADPDEFDPETLKKFGLVLHTRIYYETETRLVIDPMIHAACTPDEVEEALENCEIDETSLDDLLSNLVDKGVAIKAIMDVISKAGKISLPDLIREMDAVSLKLKDAEQRITAHASQKFVESMVSDLRKIGMIEGNDKKIRAVR